MKQIVYIHECGAQLFFTIHGGKVIDGPEVCSKCGDYINPIEIEKAVTDAPDAERLPSSEKS